MARAFLSGPSITASEYLCSNLMPKRLLVRNLFEQGYFWGRDPG